MLVSYALLSLYWDFGLPTHCIFWMMNVQNPVCAYFHFMAAVHNLIDQ
jgi:hypothetical protein